MAKEKLASVLTSYNGELIEWLTPIIDRLAKEVQQNELKGQNELKLKIGGQSHEVDPRQGPQPFPPPIMVEDLRNLIDIMKKYQPRFDPKSKIFPEG